jgi:hypothetical protein
MTKFVFESFLEYYHYFKHLSSTQRDIIFSSLSDEEQKRLDKACRSGGWKDLLVRNELNRRLDELKQRHNIDAVQLRCKVIAGKSVYVSSALWDDIIETFDGYENTYTQFILGDIKNIRVDKDTVLLLKKKP